MRILALRGANLASLAGGFEIDLTRGALGRAGLFAITGPTGAGKSTLLDAICLALYGTTPRLSGTGGPRVGRRDQEEADRLSAFDARGLLHRGSSRAFAEVDFEGVDGARFRARWEVRRARDRADGRVQPAVQTLHRLDDPTGPKALGGTNTETLAAIREHLGLSFDQFRRSALLAQGDFAAFLHAKPRDRAELLEKVTGTGIYAAISRRAYERAKQADAALGEVEQRLARLELLGPGDRDDLERQRADLEADVRRRQRDVEAAQAAVGWFEVRVRLRAEREQAERELAAAAAAVEAASERRERLARVQRLRPRVSVLNGHDEAALRLLTARQRHQEALAAVRRADEELAAAQVEEEAATAAWREAAARREAAEPELARATELDALLREARQEAERLRGRAAAREEAVRQAAQARAAIAQQLEAATERRQRAQAWLDERPHLRGLADAWEAVAAAVRDHVEAAEGLRALGAEAAAASEAVEARRGEWVVASNARLEAAERLRRAEEAVAASEARVRPEARDALATRRARADRRREAAAQAVALAEQARRDRDEALRERTAIERIEARASAASAAIAEVDRELPRAEARLEEARRAYDQARAVMQLEAHRSELREGEPCPLCGATEHPWATGAPPLEEGLAARVRSLEAALRALAERRLAEEATRAAATEEREGARVRLEGLEARRAALAARWAAIAWHDLPDDPGADDALARAEACLEDARRAVERLDEESRALSALERAAAEARARRDADRAELLAAEQAERAAEAALRGAEERVRELARRQEQLRDAQAAAWRAIARAWPAAEAERDAFAADPAAVAGAWEREARVWRRAEVALDQTRETLEVLGPKGAAAESDLRAAQAAAEEARAAHAAAQDALRDLAAARAEVLGGRPVAEARAALDGAAAAAERRQQAARERVGTARTATAMAAAAREASAAALEEAAAHQEHARAALNALLEAEGLDLETLRALLAHDDAWVRAEAAALDALGHARERVAAVLEERERQLQQHERSRPEEIDEDGASARLAAARSALDDAVEALQAIRLRLARDDAARAEAQQLVAERDDRARDAALWGRLSDLLGSADGAKFRRFAQGLTLDALLVQANHQLESLAPRYRLERVPGEDLELQVVDRHMGDEVRAVPSLSGGETFLASLALALGLASLSAATTPVRSLFIDEGFGTLDRRTLETVMAALDALQAQGRQVGIISHVEGLADQVGVQIRVERLGGGRSRVVPPPGSGPLDTSTRTLDIT